MAGQVAGADRVGAGQQAEHGQGGDDQEGGDGHHLDAGEPELELAVGGDRAQVGRGQHGHHDQGERPLRDARHPAVEDLRAGGGLDGQHHDPEEPVQPADAEAGPAAQRPVRVGGEGAALRVGRGHLAQHPHDQDDQHTGQRVGEQDAGAGGGDTRARADEQAGADHTADGDHRQVAVLEAGLEVAVAAVAVPAVPGGVLVGGVAGRRGSGPGCGVRTHREGALCLSGAARPPARSPGGGGTDPRIAVQPNLYLRVSEQGTGNCSLSGRESPGQSG